SLFIHTTSPTEFYTLSLHDALPIFWLNTAVGSNFDTFYSNRYLTTLHTKLLHTQLENIPYQHIIILANTDFYGGGGILNSYSLRSEEHTSELQSRENLVCRLLLEKK